MSQPDFWDDPEAAASVSQERTRAREQIDVWKRLRRQLEDGEVAAQLLEEEDDPALRQETEARLEAIEAGVRTIEFRKMLSGPNDEGGAIVAVNAGAGGTEAQDWAEMLLRMYLRWSEARGYATEVVDVLPGDEAGIK
ncbi:MAG: PCRF domain-containing protein, partial [Proteobacteria bacterium]|nr:PCRF domain-containing protein [Pseudomonadota bacterium]